METLTQDFETKMWDHLLVNKTFSVRQSNDYLIYKNKHHTLIIDQVIDYDMKQCCACLFFEGNVQSTSKESIFRVNLLISDYFFS